MLTRLKLWNLERQIKRLEQYEFELEVTLKAVRTKALPELRIKRNTLMFKHKRFA